MSRRICQRAPNSSCYHLIPVIGSMRRTARRFTRHSVRRTRTLRLVDSWMRTRFSKNSDRGDAAPSQIHCHSTGARSTRGRVVARESNSNGGVRVRARGCASGTGSLAWGWDVLSSSRDHWPSSLICPQDLLPSLLHLQRSGGYRPGTLGLAPRSWAATKSVACLLLADQRFPDDSPARGRRARGGGNDDAPSCAHRAWPPSTPARCQAVIRTLSCRNSGAQSAPLGHVTV